MEIRKIYTTIDGVTNIICVTCKETKPISEYYFRKNRNKTTTMCKKCFSAYQCAVFVKKKKKAVEYLGGICRRCGHKYPYVVFDFHHKGNKDYRWNDLRGYAWVHIKKELQKCILLCANCHRLEHMDLVKEKK